MDLKKQYDKIYRYCYFRVRNRETAEDITQETFLRYIENTQYHNKGKDLQYLYTIARNLCIDEARKSSAEQLNEENSPVIPLCDDDLLTHMTLQNALQELPEEERELILLRYVNEEPVSVISSLYGISRFAINRRLKTILTKLRRAFGKEES